eukprot:11270035-Alexandrium_andersonii.AAC.1
MAGLARARMQALLAGVPMMPGMARASIVRRPWLTAAVARLPALTWLRPLTTLTGSSSMSSSRGQDALLDS